MQIPERTAVKASNMKRDIPNHDKKLALIVLATFGAVVLVEMSLLFFSIWTGA